MDLSTSTALVTGANRGLGRALAADLLSRGASVYAAARNPEQLDLAGAKPIALDITDPASVAAAAAATGNVTVLINNAGISTGTDLLTGDLDNIRLEMDTHYHGTLSAVRAFAPQIADNGGGAILNILSVLSWYSFPEAGPTARPSPRSGRSPTRCAFSSLTRGSAWPDCTSDTWIPT